MTREKPGAAQEVTIPVDPVTEQVILAAAFVDAEARILLLRRLVSDHFAAPKHAALWAALAELVRRGLEFDPAVLRQIDPDADVDYVAQLMEARPELPPNLEHHVQTLLWDHCRASAVRGPISALIQAVRDPRSEPDRVRSLAQQVGVAFEGHGDRRYMRSPAVLVREQMAEIEARSAGLACWSYGIDRLDYYETAVPISKPVRRLVPGPAPGQITVVTGVPGSGKSTLTRRIVIGLGRQRRRVLIGSWEQNSGTNLELLALMSMGFVLTRSQQPLADGGFTKDEKDQIRDRMERIAKYVTFMDLPFNREMKGRPTNKANLDLVQGYIADSGCEVFVADLWERLLVEDEPNEEKRALFRQQAMCEELKIHAILVHQQRSKDIEQRVDKKPTREGMKGTGAWTEVPDTILGTHRPALWKEMNDNVFEVDVLKQRYGKWPQAVEFDWDPETGLIAGGHTVPYDNPSSGGHQAGGIDDFFKGPKQAKGGRR